jgi:hypothetical protein
VDFEQSLNKAVNRLREALCDDAGQPRYVETIPRRGYRFVAPVTGHTATEEREAMAASRVDPDLAVGKPGRHIAQSHKTLTLAVGGMVVALAIAGVLGLKKPRGRPRQEASITSAGFAPVLSRDGKLLAYLRRPDAYLGTANSRRRSDSSDYWSGPGLPVRFLAGWHANCFRFDEKWWWALRYAYSSRRAEAFGQPTFIPEMEFSNPRFAGRRQDPLLADDSTAIAVSVAGGQPIPWISIGISGDGPPLWSPERK